MKRKTILILFIFFVTFNVGFAQRLYLFTGESVPIGSFGSTSSKGAKAKPAFFLQGETSYLINRKLGVDLAMTFNNHEIDTQSWDQQLREQFQYKLNSIESNKYNSFVIVVGPYYNIWRNKLIQVSCKGGPGLYVSLFDNPTMKVSSLDSNNNNKEEDITLQFSSGTHIAIGTGIITHLYLTKFMGVTLNLDYLYSSSKVSTDPKWEGLAPSRYLFSYFNVGMGLFFGG